MIKVLISLGFLGFFEGVLLGSDGLLNFGEYLTVGASRAVGNKSERVTKDPSDEDGRRYGKRAMLTPPHSGSITAAVPYASPPRLVLGGGNSSLPFSPVSLVTGVPASGQSTVLPVAAHAMPESGNSPVSYAGSPDYGAGCFADDEDSSDEDAPPPGITRAKTPAELGPALAAVAATFGGLSIDIFCPSVPTTASPPPSSRVTGIFNFNPK